MHVFNLCVIYCGVLLQYGHLVLGLKRFVENVFGKEGWLALW